MELKDFISITALIVSLISLSISVWSSRFSKRAKLSELRAAVLAKSAEASSRITHIYDLELQMRRHAEELGDSEGFELIDLADTEQIHEQANKAYKDLSELPPNQGLVLHEKLFHIFQRLAEDAARMETTTRENHARYLAIHKLPHGA